MSATEVLQGNGGGLGAGARHPWLASVAVERQDSEGWFYVYTHRTRTGWATKELRLLKSGRGVVCTRRRYFRDHDTALAARERWAGPGE